MDNRPIGVFDSGLGGLTSVRRLMQVLPNEDLIYLGDTGRVPYGSRSRDTIIKYSKQDAAFLCRFDIKAIVVACNTASTAAIGELKSTLSVPVFGVLDATVEKAAKTTKSGRIGVVGTQATIRSGAYSRMLHDAGRDLFVIERACPLLVSIVECGRTDRNDVVVRALVSDYLSEIRAANVDTLILGCTHFPLLFDAIADFMGPEVALIDSGAATAEMVSEYLRENEMLSDRKDIGARRYFVTDTTDGFQQSASLFLGCNVEENVEQVSLEDS